MSFAGCIFTIGPLLIALSVCANIGAGRASVTDSAEVSALRSPRMSDKGSSRRHVLRRPRALSEPHHAADARVHLRSPRLVALGAEREREAAALLAELLHSASGERSPADHDTCDPGAAGAIANQLSATRARTAEAGSNSAGPTRARLRARRAQAVIDTERATRRRAAGPPGSSRS